MTNLREAAQMALDALEHGLPIIEDFGGKEQLQLQHKAIAVLYEALRAALAQPEQEPVAWMHDSHVGFNVPLYTAPPQRDWQGLTDEEIEKLVYDIRSQTTGVVATAYVARAIEAKLREKNK